MYHACGVHVHVVHVSRPQGRAQGLTPKAKLFMGVSSMWVGVVGVCLYHHKHTFVVYSNITFYQKSSILIAHMMQVSLTGVRISFVPRRTP